MMKLQFSNFMQMLVSCRFFVVVLHCIFATSATATMFTMLVSVFGVAFNTNHDIIGYFDVFCLCFGVFVAATVFVVVQNFRFS